MIKSIVVFCGSKSGNDEGFTTAAKQLGKLLAQKNITLIYGGGNKGLMGDAANAALENNGRVIGIIPEVLKDWEHAHNGLTQLHVVADMHVRKKMLYEFGDAAIILPGGNGTLVELFEMLTWNTLQIHNKKVFILNINGFYNHLIQHMQIMFEQGFLYEPPQERVIILDSALQLNEYL